MKLGILKKRNGFFRIVTKKEKKCQFTQRKKTSAIFKILLAVCGFVSHTTCLVLFSLCVVYTSTPLSILSGVSNDFQLEKTYFI